MHVRVGLWRKLSAKELMLLNCGVGEDSWESLGLQIQPVHSKGDQSWVFIGRTDAEAETPILWPPHAKNWLIAKDPDAGRDWGQEEKGMTEDEMAGWHHRLDGYEFEWTPGVGDGQGGLACCDFMGSQRVGHDWAAELNWTELRVCFPSPVYGLEALWWVMATSSKRAYAIPRSAAPRAPASAAVHCWSIPPRRSSNTALSQSLWSLWVLVCTRFVWALWASLVGMGFDSKCHFAPPTILLGPLCPWMWVISSQLFSAVQPTLQSSSSFNLCHCSLVYSIYC